MSNIREVRYTFGAPDRKKLRAAGLDEDTFAHDVINAALAELPEPEEVVEDDAEGEGAEPDEAPEEDEEEEEDEEAEDE